nr:putative transposase En/Spm [Ipomoea batatas]
MLPFTAPSIAQVHHVVLRDHQEVVVKMSQRKRNREEGSTPVMETPRNEVHRRLEDTDSEHTPSSSRPTEHTTEGPSEHTSYVASESIDEATLGGEGEGMTTESPPSTIPADRFTTFIRTVGRVAFEPHTAHRHIILFIQRMFTQPIRSFKYAPQQLKDVWFNEFKKKHRWDPSEEDTVRCIFKKKGAKLLSDHLREAHEGFARKIERNHTGFRMICGSIPMTEHRRRLKEKLGEDPSHAALYEHTHKRKNGNGAYVCRKAHKVVDVANDLRQSQPNASNAQLWLEAIGGVKRGGYVYGFGSNTQHYFPEASRGSNSKSVESSSNAALLAEIQQMREENKMLGKTTRCSERRLADCYVAFSG